MTLDQPKEFVVQEKRDAKARLVINDELSSVCHCCTALKYRCKSLYGFAFENTNSLHKRSGSATRAGLL